MKEAEFQGGPAARPGLRRLRLQVSKASEREERAWKMDE